MKVKATHLPEEKQSELGRITETETIKYPYEEEVVSHDPDELFVQYVEQQKEIDHSRISLKIFLVMHWEESR